MLSHDFALKGDQTYPAVTLDGDNLPYVVWQDTRSFVDNTITTDSNVFMQKFTANGVPQWPAGTSPVTIGGTQYTAPYSVMDIRVDTYLKALDGQTANGGTGTHYSGRPRTGVVTGLISDNTRRIAVAFEDNRNDGTTVDTTSCGRANSSVLVNVCAQSYDVADYGIGNDLTPDNDWDVFFFTSDGTTPDLSVYPDIMEWDGTQAAILGAKQTWTDCTGNCTNGTGVMQTLTWVSTSGTPPPSDTVELVTFRRLRVRFLRNAGNVTIEYDNTGVESRLATGDVVPERSIILSLVIPFLPPLIYWWLRRRKQ